MVGSTERPGRVLHVDDDPDLAGVVAEFLEHERPSLSVTTATSAAEGLDRFHDGDFDCIVSDYDMPRMNGLEFLSAVREMDADVPFILYTGKGSEEIASRAISAGVTDYIQKTTGTEEYTLLANRIEEAVEKRRVTREARRVIEGLKTAREGIGILDEDGRYVYLNEAYADLHGRDVAEIEGKHWSTLYPDGEVERFRSEILPELREEGSWSGRATGRRADGTGFAAELTLSRIDDGGHVCVVRDVTEREARQERVERGKERLRAVVESLPVVLFTIDGDGTFTLTDGKGLESLGVAPDEVVGTSIEELNGDYAGVATAARRALDGEPTHEVHRIDGTAFETWYRPVTDGGTVERVVGVAVDPARVEKLGEGSSADGGRYV